MLKPFRLPQVIYFRLWQYLFTCLIDETNAVLLKNVDNNLEFFSISSIWALKSRGDLTNKVVS